MAERYSRLFSLERDLYFPESPVIVRAGALLKDEQTGSVLAQLKFGRISSEALKAIKVAVQPFDVAGNPLGEPASHQYLDLRVGRGGEFGQKEAILLPDATARSFSVIAVEAVFEDGTQWASGEDELHKLPDPQPLENRFVDSEVRKQYRIEFGDSCRFVPQEFYGLWRCSCGTLNNRDEESCYRCGLSRELLMGIDEQELSSRKDARLAEEAAKARRSRRIGVLAGVLVALLIAAVLVYTQVVVPAQERERAEAAAIEAEMLAAEHASQVEMLKVTNGALATAQVGDSVYLGSYEQNNDLSDGAEDIEWRVLSMDGDRVLLISTCGLDAHVFDKFHGNNWGNSELRMWLESEFFDDAFTERERANIDGTPFCLELEEAETLFFSDADRMCRSTAYAESQGVRTSDRMCSWWLRSRGSRSGYVAIVGVEGRIFPGGYHVGFDSIAIRPAIWVNL